MITLNVDYLDFNASIYNEQLFSDLEDKNVLQVGKYSFQNKRRDSVFYYHYDVIEIGTGREIGWFMAVTGSPERRTPAQRKIAKFRFCDALFYERGFDFDAVKDEICNGLGMEFRGVSRLDMAFDTDDNLFFRGWRYDPDKIRIERSERDGLSGYDFMLCLKHELLKRDRRFNRSRTRSIENLTKSEIREILADNAVNIIGRWQNCQTVEIGTRKSRCMARLYNKTVEMIAKGEKTFITEMWKNAGYDGKRNVFRFEIVLNRLAEQSSYFYDENGTIVEPALNDFFKPEFLFGLFDGVVCDKFNFAAVVEGEEEYLWNTCLHKDSYRTDITSITGQPTAYNCGYDVKKAVDITDAILHNNYTTWACGYLLSLNGRLRDLEIDESDRKIIEKFTRIFIDLHEDYKPTFPRERSSAASLIAAHREIEREYENGVGWVVKYKKYKMPIPEARCLFGHGQRMFINGRAAKIESFNGGYGKGDSLSFGTPEFYPKKEVCTEKN